MEQGIHGPGMICVELTTVFSLVHVNKLKFWHNAHTGLAMTNQGCTLSMTPQTKLLTHQYLLP